MSYDACHHDRWRGMLENVRRPSADFLDPVQGYVESLLHCGRGFSGSVIKRFVFL